VDWRKSGERNGTGPQYDPDRGTYLMRPPTADQEEVTTVVVSAVSALTGVSVEDIDLNEVVHPGSLNRLFSDRRNGTPREGGEVVFSLAGCEVTLRGRGEILLAPPDGGSSGGPAIDD
jgi:hypothetical protein